MAATFDNKVTVDNFTVTSLTTGAFTVGSGENRAACLALAMYTAITGVSGSLGGVGASLVASTSVFNNFTGSQLWAVIAPPSGSQTATMSWTTASSASLSVTTVTGADQTTPMNNGNQTCSAFRT